MNPTVWLFAFAATITAIISQLTEVLGGNAAIYGANISNRGELILGEDF